MQSGKYWLITFILILCAASTTIIFSALFGVEQMFYSALRLISIFLGVLAGVTLGEYMKIRNNQKSAQNLMRDLITELLVNRELINNNDLLRKGFWFLGIQSGRAQFLPEKHRIDLWHIYSLITHYNEDLQHFHGLQLLQSTDSPTTNQEKEIVRLGTEIAKRIDAFFAKCPPKLVDNARQFIK